VGQAMTPIDAVTFRHALSRFPSGVTVVTVRGDDGRDYGMTVSAFASLSLQPPLVLVCIGEDATIASAVAAAGHFAVSVLSQDQEALARRFAESDADRFAGNAVTRGVGGLALLDGAAAHLQCAIVARHRGGDHTIVVGEVLFATTVEGALPLVYALGRYTRLR
jgi:3-hydroxy-9,10-secoandrosta-1,3,5(10)-triene-9,17-dione monooxygenase reductase component